jgi:hypothetical protein
MNKLKDTNRYVQQKSVKNASFIMIFVGLISIIAAFINDAHAAWTNILFNNYFFLGISIFAVFFCCSSACC